MIYLIKIKIIILIEAQIKAIIAKIMQIKMKIKKSK
jgi:hypothetical protein